MRNRTAAVCVLAVLAVLATSGFRPASAVGCGGGLFGGGGGIFSRIAERVASRVEARQQARAERVQSRQASRAERDAALNSGTQSASGCASCSAASLQFTPVTRTVNAAGKCVLCGDACACPNCECVTNEASKVVAASGAAPAAGAKAYRTETYFEKVCSVDRRGNTTCTMVPRTRVVQE